MKRDQSGMASIVAVSILVVLITLISLGFYRIMSRTSTDSANNQASRAATYAAQSAINDLAAYIKTNPTAYSSHCKDLIGTSLAPGPFYSDSNLSGDNTSQYTCLLLNQSPTSLEYSGLPISKSQVIKATTTAVPGSLDKMMISWQASDSATLNAFPPAGNNLYDQTTWNDSSHNYIPMLRVSLYPVSANHSLANIQANSKTIYLYPQNSGGNVPSINYSALTNGSIVPVSCTQAVAPGSFVGTADKTCNIILSSLSTTTLPDAIDYFYYKITPIYNKANVIIKANDQWAQVVHFKSVQAVADVTVQAAGVAKRLQARLGTGVTDTSTTATDGNIEAFDNGLPEYPLRTSDTICKRLQNVTTTYSYVTLDTTNAKFCGTLGNSAGGGLNTPGPVTSSYAIDGDGITTILDTALTPDASQKGTSYIALGASSRLKWVTKDAEDCTGSDNGWSGSRKGNMTFTVSSTGSDAVGIYNTPAQNNVTRYGLTCTGPGGSTTTKTVTAWPRPSATISGPASIQAGTPYAINWTSTNASKCKFTGNWNSTADILNPSGAAGSGSQTMPLAYTDNSSKTFTVNCTDPAGNSSGDKTLTYTVLPPDCTATVTPIDNNNGTGSLSWSGACPNANPGIGKYQVYNCVNIDCSALGAGGYVGANGGTTFGTGTYCMQFHSGLDPWAGWRADSTQICVTINNPPPPPPPPPPPAPVCTTYSTHNDGNRAVDVWGDCSGATAIYDGYFDRTVNNVNCNETSIQPDQASSTFTYLGALAGTMTFTGRVHGTNAFGLSSNGDYIPTSWSRVGGFGC